jgi:hypothetical protein
MDSSLQAPPSVSCSVQYIQRDSHQQCLTNAGPCAGADRVCMDSEAGLYPTEPRVCVKMPHAFGFGGLECPETLVPAVALPMFVVFAIGLHPDLAEAANVPSLCVIELTLHPCCGMLLATGLHLPMGLLLLRVLTVVLLPNQQRRQMGSSKWGARRTGRRLKRP